MDWCTPTLSRGELPGVAAFAFAFAAGVDWWVAGNGVATGSNFGAAAGSNFGAAAGSNFGAATSSNFGAAAGAATATASVSAQRRRRTAAAAVSCAAQLTVAQSAAYSHPSGSVVP